MPREGEAFDRYRIEAILGEGGMGVVYKAFDPRLNRRVALKVVRAQRSEKDIESSTGATARLLREARVAASLDHPNAVAIFDVGEVNGEPFIAMELVSGRTLRRYIGDATTPMTTRLRWLIDIARVLAAAHKAGLVHRDMKPENVMIRDDGDLKVLDFGIARRLIADPLASDTDGTATITRKGQSVGTPLYMAPEQIRGEAADGRTDQFAWGVVAYELLSGKSPWRTEMTPLSALNAIITQDPSPLRSIAPDVPAVVAEVITRALQKGPTARFATMDAVVAALEPLAGAPSSKMLAEGAAVSDPMLPFLQTVDTISKPSVLPSVRRARREKLLRRAAIGGAVLAIVAAVVLIVRRRAPLATASRADARSLPSGNGAAAAYAMGLEARRNGMTRVAAEGFRHTLEIDPNFAPALLRLALLDYGTGDSLKESRELFQRASVMKATLDDPDRATLDAMAPCVSQDDIVHGECEERLRAASLRYPNEMGIRVELAVQETFADKIDEAMATCKAALAIDPGYLYFAGLLGQLQAYGGHIDDALATLDACTRTQPNATGCIDYRLWIHTQRGECAAVESDAKNWIAAGPHDGGHWGPQHHLANAQVALGRPIEAVQETLAQEWSRTPSDERASLEAIDRTMLAVLAGDFTTADASMATLEKLAADDSSEDAHSVPASLRVQLDDEEGRVAEAGAVAESFLRRREGWSVNTRIDDWEMAKDVTMRMNDALLRAGKITRVEYVARRASWAGRWGKTKLAAYDWFQAYAYWARTKSDAQEALGSLPLSGLPPFHPFVYPEASMGRLYLLTDDLAHALPLLQHAANGCYALEDPFTTVRSHLWLGEALEKSFDPKGACGAYAFVIAHWGDAKPRSVTADEAKKRSLALQCPK